MLRLLNFKNRNPKNPNHPKKGSAIKVGPIRNLDAIERIKELLAKSPRDHLFFVLGINTGFRANELLSLKVGQVRNLKPGDDLELKLSKTKTYRRVTVNQAVVDAIQEFVRMKKPKDDDWLFKSTRGAEPITVSTASSYVKRWCRQAGLRGNFASHTLRKTWGFQQRKLKNTPIPLLMVAYGHSTQQQTLSYLCIQDREIADIYMGLAL